MKIKPNKLYKVEWLDIQAQANVTIDKEYNEFLCKSYTIGQIKEGKDTILVIYAGNEENDYCFDAIPKGCITKIQEVLKTNQKEGGHNEND